MKDAYFRLNDTEIRRLRGAGQIIRMEEERIPPTKMILNGEFHNTISAGKPRSRWEDVVLRDALQTLRI